MPVYDSPSFVSGHEPLLFPDPIERSAVSAYDKHLLKFALLALALAAFAACMGPTL